MFTSIYLCLPLFKQDSSHGDLQPFHCPFEGCTECFPNKSGVLQHMEFNCAKFRADGKVRDSEPESDEPPALVVQAPAPAEKITQVGQSVEYILARLQ